jgi:hypothetical protein
MSTFAIFFNFDFVVVSNFTLGKDCHNFFIYHINASFLPLGATVQGELWPPEQTASVINISMLPFSSLNVCNND